MSFVGKKEYQMVVNWKKSLAWQQILLITPVVLLVVLILAYYLTAASADMLRDEIELRATRSVELGAARLNGIFVDAERAAKTLSLVIEEELCSDEQLQDMLTRNIAELHETNPEISGGSIAYAPYARLKTRENCMWYTHFNGDRQQTVTVGEDYDYFSFPWFANSDHLKGSWSEPYFDDGLGNILMTTYSHPFQLKGKFAGVVTVDVSLQELNRYISKLSGAEGYAFLLSGSGRIVVHPNSSWIMSHTVFDLAPDNPEYQAFWRKALEPGATCMAYDFHELNGGEHGEFVIANANLDCNNWLVGAKLSQTKLFQPLLRLRHYASILAVSAVVLAMIILGVLTWRALKPLRMLAPAARRIGAGDFSAKLPKLERQDEVGQLNDAFASMQRSLQSYINKLENSTAARNRMESELSIATRIQQSLLPQRCSLNSKCGRYELFATLRPAKEVGGDLYDFFHLSDDELAVAVGDVSGKGIPGALFMAVTQTLLRGSASPQLTTGEVACRINAHLAGSNDMMMFVTFFFGVFNLSTGVLRYTNAGHNPPLIRRADGTVETMSGIQGPPLAISDHDYTTAEHQLHPGDLLLLYTDGVTEAIDDKNNEFSLNRLKNILAGADEKVTCEALVKMIVEAVSTHAGAAEQFDDITLLALRYEKSGE